MKEKVIKCPACLKNSGYTTETEFPENQFESIYEARFATKNTNGYINDGFEAMCDRCGYEFHIYGYVPEPLIEIQKTIDGRAFLEARNIKWPSFIKDFYDLKAFESVLTHLVNDGYEKTKKYYSGSKGTWLKALKFLKDKIKPIKIDEKKFSKETQDFIEDFIEEEITNFEPASKIVEALPEPWYKRILK